MLKGKTVAVVVPAYNEETQIGKVITTIPDFVDRIVIVDDKSRDGTVGKVNELKADAKYKDRLVLIALAENQGVGGAIAEGYKWARDNGICATAVMAGDGQMNPAELEGIVTPVIDDKADYVKGNRLLTENSWKNIPKTRFLGNSALSFFTKIVSGYWSVVDSQTGYTAISLTALKALNLDNIYKRYGVPNDILTKLNIHNFRLAQIPIEPVYHVGEHSKMKMGVVAFTIPCLLFRLFFYRLFFKYVVRDFHPIALYYIAGLILFLTGTIGGIVAILMDILISLNVMENVDISVGWMLFYTIFFSSGLNMLLFAMWMDRDENKNLQSNILPSQHY